MKIHWEHDWKIVGHKQCGYFTESHYKCSKCHKEYSSFSKKPENLSMTPFFLLAVIVPCAFVLFAYYGIYPFNY